MTSGRVNRPSADVVDQLNNMSLNSGQRKGWEDSTKGYLTGDGSRLNWATWAEAKKKAGKWGDDNNVEQIEDDDENDDDGSDDDGLVSDDYDSDDSQKSHDSRKKNPWLAEFFGTLDDLTAEQIVEPGRQWHCPACRDGPGSIHWFRGMKSFVAHVKTKGTRRPRLHWDFAQLLDEELCRRGATLVKSGESYGKWKGLDKEAEDWEIVWPPMVIVMNTQLEKDENEKWLGMGTQELLEYFESYEAVKARNSFGPEGHRGMSVLIFDTSAIGYLEAERLSKHFVHQGVDRDAWNRHPNLFHPDGKRQLYGFMATESDLDAFNQHSPGKSKLKSELVSYQEKVVDKLKQLNKDSEQLIWYKKKIAKQERSSKAPEDAFWLLSEKLRKIEEENKIVGQSTKMYHEQNQEELISFLCPTGRVLSSTPAYSNPNDYWTRFEVKNIDELMDLKKPGGFVVVATLIRIQSEHGWYYHACTKCSKMVERLYKPVDENSDDEGVARFECGECGVVTDVYPKIKVQVRVQDATGSISFVLFERDVTGYVHKPASKLISNANNVNGEHFELFPAEFNMFVGKRFAFKIKVSKYNIDNNYYVYSVGKFSDEDSVIDAILKKAAGDEDAPSDVDIHVLQQVPSFTGLSATDAISGTGENATPLEAMKSTASSSGSEKVVEHDDGDLVITCSTSKGRPDVNKMKIPKLEKF